MIISITQGLRGGGQNWTKLDYVICARSLTYKAKSTEQNSQTKYIELNQIYKSKSEKLNLQSKLFKCKE